MTPLAALIREARQARGWSIVAAARALIDSSPQPLPDVDSVVRSWKRWEHATTPSRFYRPLLANLLGIDPAALAGPNPRKRGTSITQRSVADPVLTPQLLANLTLALTAPPGQTLQALRRHASLSQQELAAALTHELGIKVRPGAIRAWEHSETTPPPEILAIGTRLPTLPGMQDLPPDTESELQRGLDGGRIGAHIMTWASQQVAALSRLDDQLGGAQVLPLVTGNLNLLMQLISQATFSDTHAIELRRTVAEVSRLAGWVAFDAGYADQADRYWRTAITAAREANDRDYSAYAMACLAFHAIDYQRDPSAALKLLQAAEQEANRDAPLRVVLAQWAVQPYGLLGEHREAQRSLTRADSLWEQRTPENDPPWLYWMYLPSLSPEVPRGIIPGDPSRAEAMLIDGLDALSEEYPRDRTLFLLGVAEARLAQHGRLDEAIEATRTTIDLISSTPSPRIRERLKRLIRGLPEHPDTAELREPLIRPRAARA